MSSPIHILYRPFLTYFRRKRAVLFNKKFKHLAQSKVIDIGGSKFNWSFMPEFSDVTIINVDRMGESDHRFKMTLGDGRNLPHSNHAFEIAYSNSVIEHVGSYKDQERFAEEIRRVAVNYYVQTPNYWFPIEPHFITAFLHWLPKRHQKFLMRFLSLRGIIGLGSKDDITALVDELRLLDEKSFQKLFPDAVIFREKFLFLTKSLIAIREQR